MNDIITFNPAMQATDPTSDSASKAAGKCVNLRLSAEGSSPCLTPVGKPHKLCDATMPEPYCTFTDSGSHSSLLFLEGLNLYSIPLGDSGASTRRHITTLPSPPGAAIARGRHAETHDARGCAPHHCRPGHWQADRPGSHAALARHTVRDPYHRKHIGPAAAVTARRRLRPQSGPADCIRPIAARQSVRRPVRERLHPGLDNGTVSAAAPDGMAHSRWPRQRTDPVDTGMGRTRRLPVHRSHDRNHSQGERHIRHTQRH